MPALAAAVAIFMELPVAFAVAVVAFTRPAAVLMALYTLGTSLIEHRHWRTTGAAQVEIMRPFTGTSALSEASCCCTLSVRENIRLMCCHLPEPLRCLNVAGGPTPDKPTVTLGVLADRD